MSLTESISRRRNIAIAVALVAFGGAELSQANRFASERSRFREVRDAVAALVERAPGYAADQAWFDEQLESAAATAYETSYTNAGAVFNSRKYREDVLTAMFSACFETSRDADAEYFRAILVGDSLE